MRILFIIDSLTSGGKERRMSELLKSLVKVEGTSCALIIMSKEVFYDDILNLDIPIHYLIRNTRKDFTIFKKLYTYCIDFKPDMVHCWDSMTAVYSAVVCKLLGIKFINGMVIDTPSGFKILYNNWLRARFVFPISDVIIGNSNAGLKSYHAPKKKSICIYNGYNFDRSLNLQSADVIRKEYNIVTKYIIGMVAEFSILKDYKTYYEAAKRVLEKRDDVTFLALGKNTESEASKGLIEEKYKSNIRLMGRKSNIESYINIFDIGILATFTEGISNAIMEYMALGKSVIATSGGGTDEIIVDGHTGFLVKRSDPSDLSDRIITLLNDAELRLKMGERGKERVKETFSIEGMTKRYHEVYQDVIKK